MRPTFLASKMDYVCRKTYEDVFLEVTLKKVKMSIVWENL